MVKKSSSNSNTHTTRRLFDNGNGHSESQNTPVGLTLRVVGQKGSIEVFRNTTFVSTTSRFLSVLVQMSRPIYNGGQDRVVELRLGTPAVPKKGWWRVRVVTAGQVDEHPFILTKYFATRFEIHIDLPYYTLASDEALKGSFKALFRTYMPVPGNATLTYSIKEKNNTSYRNIATQLVPYAEGDHDFQLPMHVLTNNTEESNIHGVDVKVHVAFRHNFLGAVVKAYASTRIIEPTIKVELLGASPIIFKPGMSLTTAVGVSYHDQEPLEEHRLRNSTLIVSPSVVMTSGSTINLPKVMVEPKVKDPLPWKEILKIRNFNASILDLESEDRTNNLLQVYAHKSVFDRYHKEGILE
ncbi:hypothetical protein SK128_009997 [Halocaridina rubra]|uniref:Macroglobulin domain-containing protein n=1 Tax=Halocaridina rubra TaxID=373956 RepID=A0AAN9A757_HALRR